jgi:hypothetical protein
MPAGLTLRVGGKDSRAHRHRRLPTRLCGLQLDASTSERGCSRLNGSGGRAALEESGEAQPGPESREAVGQRSQVTIFPTFRLDAGAVRRPLVRYLGPSGVGEVPFFAFRTNGIQAHLRCRALSRSACRPESTQRRDERRQRHCHERVTRCERAADGRWCVMAASRVQPRRA